MMGTSTVHRSPNTAAWRIVNNLYDDPSVPPARVLAEVFNAASEHYRRGLADASVLTRVEIILDVSRRVATLLDRPETALAVARDAVAKARTSALAAGRASFYGDLADRAVHATLAMASRDPQPLTADATLRNFLGHLVATAVDHVVSRDLTGHVGGNRIRSVSDAMRLRATLTSLARQIAADDRLAASVTAAVRSPKRDWPLVIKRAWDLGSSRGVPRQRGKR
jgi:hypothetical protein